MEKKMKRKGFKGGGEESVRKGRQGEKRRTWKWNKIKCKNGVKKYDNDKE